jgi:hypothetical protein
MLLQGSPRIAHTPSGFADGLKLGRKASEGIQDRPVRHRIDQGTIVMLAMDLDQARANGFEHLNADRLIIHKGAGAPVGHLNAAQDQVAIHIDIGFRGNPAGRMIERTVEDSRYLTLRLAMTDKAAIASSPKSQCKSIEQDGFASACLTREDTQPLMKVKLKPVDEDDIANRQLDQHGR